MAASAAWTTQRLVVHGIAQIPLTDEEWSQHLAPHSFEGDLRELLDAVLGDALGGTGSS